MSRYTIYENGTSKIGDIYLTYKYRGVDDEPGCINYHRSNEGSWNASYEWIHTTYDILDRADNAPAVIYVDDTFKWVSHYNVFKPRCKKL